MPRRVTMFQLQELVRLHRLGTTCHEVARMLGVSPNTERAYREAIRDAGLLEGGPKDLPDEAKLHSVVQAALGDGRPVPQPSSVGKWLPKITAWYDKGARPQAIYDRLKREEEDFTGSLSAVKRACAKHRRMRGVMPEDVAIPVMTEPGAIAQVDFGYIGKLLDPRTMVLRKAWVFVMLLGHCRHQYCEICFDQKVETWLMAHVRAFEHFGGVPHTIVPDNLKAAVIRAAFGADDDVALHRSYRELARHYGFKVDPTPPYAPEKKGKVESSVKYVKNNFFSTCDRNRDAHALQKDLAHWVMETAGKRIHGTTKARPLELFERVEKAALRPLPDVRFVPVLWKPVKVHRDSHVQVQGALYSVPFRFIGKQGFVRQSQGSIEVFLEDLRVASHRKGRPGQRITVEEHLPEGRRDLRHRSRSHWEARAQQLGPEGAGFVRELFEQDDVLSQLRKVQACVTYLEKFPVHRREAACKRARFFGNYSYQALKSILTQGIEGPPLPLVMQRPTTRSVPRYARNIEALIATHLEDCHEPN